MVNTPLLLLIHLPTNAHRGWPGVQHMSPQESWSRQTCQTHRVQTCIAYCWDFAPLCQGWDWNQYWTNPGLGDWKPSSRSIARHQNQRYPSEVQDVPNSQGERSWRQEPKSSETPLSSVEMSSTSRFNFEPTYRASRVSINCTSTWFHRKPRYTMDSHILHISHNEQDRNLRIRRVEPVPPGHIDRQMAG